MNKLLSYSGINTKIRALESNLITIDDFYNISNLETVADFIAFLKKHPGYMEIFSRYDEHELHRGDAERIFVNGLYLDFTKIYRFANQEQRKNLEIIFFRYEVNILKACIRLIYNQEEAYDLSKFETFFQRHSNINVSLLAASHSMEEYINHLKGTRYHPLFVKLQNSNHATSFDYEMQLDIFYFKKTWKLKDKHLTSSNLKSFTDSIGTEIDLLNIMWIFRSKTSYDMNTTDILSYIIPINYKLPKEQLMKMVNSSTIEELFSIIRLTHYKSFVLFLQDGTMESAFRSIIDRRYKTNKNKYPASMATVNYYLYQKRTEIGRLTTALECIRYGLEPQDKLKYILA